MLSYLLADGSVRSLLDHLGQAIGDDKPGLGLYDSEQKAPLCHSSWCEGCTFPTEEADREDWLAQTQPLSPTRGQLDYICLCRRHLTPTGPCARDCDERDLHVHQVVACTVEVCRQHAASLAAQVHLLRALGRAYASRSTGLALDRLQNVLAEIPWVTSVVVFRLGGDQQGSSRADYVVHSGAPHGTLNELLTWMQETPQEIDPGLHAVLLAKSAIAVQQLSSLFPGLRGRQELWVQDLSQRSYLAAVFSGDSEDYVFLCILVKKPPWDADHASLPLLADLAKRYHQASHNRALLMQALPSRLVDGQALAQNPFLPESGKAAVDTFVAEGVGGYVDLRQEVVSLCERLAEGYHLERVLADVFPAFSQTEALLYRIPSYRDHLLHQVLVFALGLEILRAMALQGRDIRGVFDQAYPDSAPWTDVRIGASWFLASVFHDISFPLAKIPEWSSALLRNLDGLGATRRPWIADKRALRSTFRARVNAVAEHLASAFGQEGASVGGVRGLLTRALLEELDHGVLSSGVLLARAAGEPAALPSASAIALHKNLLLPRSTRGVIDSASPDEYAQLLLALATPSRGLPRALPFTRHPLAGLLVFCDTAQEWARTGAGSSRPEGVCSLLALTVTGNSVTASIAVPAGSPAHYTSMLRHQEVAMARIASMDPRFVLQTEARRVTEVKSGAALAH